MWTNRSVCVIPVERRCHGFSPEWVTYPLNVILVLQARPEAALAVRNTSDVGPTRPA